MAPVHVVNAMKPRAAASITNLPEGGRAAAAAAADDNDDGNAANDDAAAADDDDHATVGDHA